MKVFPWIINVELTNLCNLKCIFCDHPVLKKTMDLGYMGDQILHKMLGDVKALGLNESIHELGLVGLGEPTMDRHLSEHLELIAPYAHLFNRISFNSNLVPLNGQRAELLLGSAINVYTFSINSSNRKAYLQTMGKDRYREVIRNLKQFLEIRNQVGARSEVNIQVFESTNSTLEELLRDFPDNYDDKVNFFTRKVYNKPVIQDGTDLVEIYRPCTLKRHPCWDIYTRIYIDREGYLYPCTVGNDCYRSDSELCLGNLMDASLDALFNNERIKQARARAEQGKLPFPQCEKCNIWALTPNNFTWKPGEQRWRKKKSVLRAYDLHQE